MDFFAQNLPVTLGHSLRFRFLARGKVTASLFVVLGVLSPVYIANLCPNLRCHKFVTQIFGCIAQKSLHFFVVGGSANL